MTWIKDNLNTWQDHEYKASLVFRFPLFINSWQGQHLNTVGIWIVKIWLAETSEQTFTCLLFRCPIIVWIVLNLTHALNRSATTAGLMSIIQAMIWKVDNFVRFSEHHLNNRPFDNLTNVMTWIPGKSDNQIVTLVLSALLSNQTVSRLWF